MEERIMLRRMYRVATRVISKTKVRRTVWQIATKRGYSVDKELKRGKAYRLAQNGEIFVFKRTTDVGIAVLRDVIPNLTRSELMLPQFVEGGENKEIGLWVITRWCPGRDFENRWSEQNPLTAGGCAVYPDTIPPILDVSLGHAVLWLPRTTSRISTTS